MAPYESFDLNMPVASNWEPSMLNYVYNNGCPSRPAGCPFPPLPPSPCTSPCCATTSVPLPRRDTCQLPEVSCMPRQVCNDHPTDAYCRVPCCDPCPPEDPPICVERVRPVKKVETYEPPSQPFEGCSLYRTQFRGCCGLPATLYKPLTSFDPPRAPMSGLSLYREQFTCKPIGPIERPKKKDDYAPSCSPFNGCSTYRIDYRGCCGMPAQSVKPPTTFDLSSGKMNGITTYRSEFLPFCPAELKYARGDSVKPMQTPYMSCSPFEGCSTYRVDYSPKCSRRTPSMKPADKTGYPSAKFGGRSTYRNDYRPFCYSDCCPDPCLPADPCRRCC